MSNRNSGDGRRSASTRHRPARPAGLVGASAFAMCMAAPVSLAYAQQWSAGVEGRASVGYTDNVRSSAGEAEMAGDVFYRLRPGVGGYLNAPRATVFLGYALDVLIFQQNRQSNALTHAVVGLAVIETSERGQLQVEGEATFGQINNVLLQTEPEAGSVDFVPAGDNTFRNLSVSERFRWQASERTRWFHNAGIRSFDTSNDGARASATLGVQAGGGFEVATEGNTFDVSSNVRYLQLEAAGALGGEQDFVDVGAQARWRRVLGESWVAALQGGALFAVNTDADVGDRLRLVGGAELAYFARWGGAAVSYRRTSDPNLFLGVISTADSVTARAFLPLLGGEEQSSPLTLATSIGRQWGNGLDLDTGMDRGEWTTTLADVALLWAIRPALRASARYQFADQRGDGTLLPDYRRNTVTVEVTATYGGPPQQAPSVSDLAERETAEEIEAMDAGGEFDEGEGLAPR